MKIYLKDHDLNNYPDKEVVFACLKESFAMSNKEVCTILNDVRFR